MTSWLATTSRRNWRNIRSLHRRASWKQLDAIKRADSRRLGEFRREARAYSRYPGQRRRGQEAKGALVTRRICPSCQVMEALPEGVRTVREEIEADKGTAKAPRPPADRRHRRARPRE